MRLILAIDIGSSSIRCSAYEICQEDGASVRALEDCRASRTVRSVQPNTGKIHLLAEDGHKSLLDNLDDCIDEVLETLRKRKEQTIQVVAVAFSSFVMNLVGVDAEGTIVGQEASISYACNSPNVAAHCVSLRLQLGQEGSAKLYQSTGAPIHSAYALPQLLDFYSDKDNPAYNESRSNVHKWQTIASICISRWIGAKFLPISLSEASWTGLLNYQRCEYEPSAINFLPDACRQALPSLADISDGTYGIGQQCAGDASTSNPYWDQWPELRGGGCRLLLGLGDGACANIGSKCSTASRIAVTIGTSAAARVCLPLPVSNKDVNSMPVPRGLFCYRIDRGHVLLGGALTDGGSVVEWVANLLNLSTPEALEACMKQVESLLEKEYQSDANTGPPLTVVPFLGGERSTGYRDGATGAILGLTRETTPAHLLKSCLEGVTLRLNAVLRLILTTIQERNDSSETTPCVVASGKALEINASWRQMLSDCCGLDVIMDGETEEGTSRGAAVIIATALLAGTASPGFTDEPLSVKYESTSNPSRTGHWTRASTAQESFIDAISPLYGS